MAEHPIQGLMQTSLENIKSMINVNTIIGDPVQTPNGDVIMSISKVAFGFAAGGSDIACEVGKKTPDEEIKSPFGGGSGGGVSITPIAFLVVGTSGAKIIPLDNQTHLIDRVIDHIPNVINKISDRDTKKETEL